MKKTYVLRILYSLWFLSAQLQAMQSPMPCLPNLVSNAALYKKAAQSIDYKKMSAAINIFTPHIGALLGNPEEDRIIYRKVISSVAHHQRFLHPQFKDNPELAVAIRQKPTVASKNPWFDIYDYYLQKYFHNSFIEAQQLPTTSSTIKNTLYKKMLVDLNIPCRSSQLKEYSFWDMLFRIKFMAVTIGHQVGIYDGLPLEDLRSTLYHEGHHVKYHDSIKIGLLTLLLQTTIADKSQESSQEIGAILDRYRKSMEIRADHNTYYDHAHCYKCIENKIRFKTTNKYLKSEEEQTQLGYITYAELEVIAEKQKKQNLLCEEHQKEQSTAKESKSL